MPVVIRYEQAVYGSFPFWDKGYAILARLPRLPRRVARRPQGRLPTLRRATAARGRSRGAWSRARLPRSGPWAIIRPSPQGVDDRGRPGALAFHALFLSGGDYRKAGAFPFEFARLLRTDWSADPPLASGHLPRERPSPAEPATTGDDRAARIAKALLRGRRVALEADGPIDDLARSVWLVLPVRRRARLSLATWTYTNGGRHDLAALPRLAGVALDPSYVDPTTLRHPRDPDPDYVPAIPLVGVIAWSMFALFALMTLGLVWAGRR